ncbi:MAG: hypothetical protein AUI14_04380 [Actinobacteria bacterium 13_2_20CM_2_71_6]|nr:MAG: hypothetical protein AUI14_04380 [Actinobacteria bacterium 13_2_20CM_2_71_6]
MVALNSLPDKEKQDAVLRALFDPRDGAGFSVMKTVLGSTDFQSASQDWFSYDDTPDDVDLTDFSIARDLAPTGELTYIRRARQAGGSFALQASMDYPPDWMLTTLADKGHQNVDPRYYDALARYYVRYLQEYQQQGVHIEYLSLFNEPGAYTKIPSSDLNVLIRDHVGPLFAAQHVNTGLIATEVATRNAAVEYYAPIVADPTTRRFVDVLGYHGYFGDGADVVAQLHRSVPGIPLWMTEICCMHAGDGDFYANQILDDLESGASAWIYWNMILDENGGPWLVSPVHEDLDPNGQPAIVHINRTTHEVVYTGLYYYLAHFSRFVRPGSVRLGTAVSSASSGVRAMAFRTGDGSIVTELVNSADAARTVQVRWRGGSVPVALGAKSITTLRWPAA